MAQSDHETLASFIDRWVEQHQTTVKALCDGAGLPHSIFTQLRKGATPRPETLRKVAKAMDLPAVKLFLLAGYLTENDLLRVPEVGLAEDEAFLLAGYRKLSAEGKALLKRGLHGMLEYTYRRDG